MKAELQRVKAEIGRLEAKIEATKADILKWIAQNAQSTDPGPTIHPELGEYREEWIMATAQESRNWLVALLGATVFSLMTASVMMGPLLVALAGAFNTSVAAAGQLAAAIGISWGITAPLVGPISDSYGRRRVALTGVTLAAAGILGSLLVWNYWGLLACRLLMGVGGAMIPPNSAATIADHFAPEERGRPMSLLISVAYLGSVVGLPAVAALGAIGGWRLPFAVVGAFFAIIAAWHWFAFPQDVTSPRVLGFTAHFRQVGRRTTLWFVLLANVLYRSASFAIFTYLAAFLVLAYGMKLGQTAFPLAAIGLGAMLGSILGGYVVSRAHGGSGPLWALSLVVLALAWRSTAISRLGWRRSRAASEC